MSAFPMWQEIEAQWDKEAFLAGWAQAAREDAAGWGMAEVGEALARWVSEGQRVISGEARGAFEAGRLAGIASAMGR